MGSSAPSSYVTPRLFVGAQAEFDFVSSGSVDEAAALIRSGKTVMVATHEMAADVLRALGASEDLVQDRIYFSKTGQVLHDL